MGSGASAGLAAAAAASSSEALKEALSSVKSEDRKRLAAVLAGLEEAGQADAPASKEADPPKEAAAAPAEEKKEEPAAAAASPDASAGGGKKVLIVATSAKAMGEHTTGAWSEEITGPYYVFKDGGCDVTVCSIGGGDVPIDAGSLSDQFKTDNDKKMESEGSGPLKGTKALKDLDVASFEVVWFAGGHGTCVDFPTDEVGAAVSKAFSAGKVVGLVCHGPMALVNAKAGDDAFVKGKKITCFSDVEEGQVGLTEKVPFLLEKKLKELGAEVEIADPWSDKAVQDGKLVTGQNPQSSVSAAKLALAAAK
mmetsp:Transcript_55308/g.124608  ORF Transcript_55308/g.124608 Transcript_55308/m.124608 type:complete len:309 (-) Transcript_55308:47-973(-)